MPKYEVQNSDLTRKEPKQKANNYRLSQNTIQQNKLRSTGDVTLMRKGCWLVAQACGSDCSFDNKHNI